MEREPATTTRTARLIGASGVALWGIGLVSLLSPDGLVDLTGGASASAYRRVVEMVAHAPSGVGPLLAVATEATLVVLGLLLVRVGWTAIRRKDARGVAGAALIGLGTVAAYAMSEAVKLVVEEERPCRGVDAAAGLVADCPDVGDWSFPSNHATLAAGLAVGLAVLWPRLAAITLPLAGLAAILRVLVGAHYPHDVLAGAVVGTTAVGVVVLVFLPPARWAVSRLGLRRGNDPGLVGHHRGGRAVVHAEPRQDGADVRFNRSFHDVQPPSDLPVGQAAPEEDQYLPFPGRESRHPLPGRGASTGRGSHAGRGQMRDDPGGDLR